MGDGGDVYFPILCFTQIIIVAELFENVLFFNVGRKHRAGFSHLINKEYASSA